MKQIAILLLLISTFRVSAQVQNSPSELLETKLLARIRATDSSLSGVLGVAAIDLQTGKILRYNADTLFPQASSIKIPIMMEVFRSIRAGKLKMNDPVTLMQSDAVGGSGHLRILLRSHPITVTVRELVEAMIETSDNTATNRLIAMVGMDAVNRSLGDLGFKNTRLQRRMLEPGAAKENRENISTPAEMAHLAELLYRGKAVDAEASREMIEILKLVEANFRSSIPGRIPIASKPGELNGVHAETGIIFLPGRPFVLSVMSTYLDQGTNPVPEVARMVFDYFEKLSHSNQYGNNLQ
jgi:beta-lactamase class A